MHRRVGTWFERRLIRSLQLFNTLLHVMLALALAAASVMVIMEFVSEVADAIRDGNATHDFLNALGILFLLWTLSSLIAAEINYVQGGRVQLTVFLEVAMITLLRSLITEPIQLVANHSETAASSGFDVVRYGSLVVAILVVGIAHRMVRSAELDQLPLGRRPASLTPPPAPGAKPGPPRSRSRWPR